LVIWVSNPTYSAWRGRQRRVGAIPYRSRFSNNDARGDILNVLAFDIGKLTLHTGHVDVEQAEVGLRDDGLDHRSAFGARRARRGGEMLRGSVKEPLAIAVWSK
jgi:hypothetical protein